MPNLGENPASMVIWRRKFEKNLKKKLKKKIEKKIEKKFEKKKKM